MLIAVRHLLSCYVQVMDQPVLRQHLAANIGPIERRLTDVQILTSCQENDLVDVAWAISGLVSAPDESDVLGLPLEVRSITCAVPVIHERGQTCPMASWMTYLHLEGQRRWALPGAVNVLAGLALICAGQGAPGVRPARVVAGWAGTNGPGPLWQLGIERWPSEEDNT